MAHGFDLDREFSRVRLADVCDAHLSTAKESANSVHAESILQAEQWAPCSKSDLALGYTDATLWLKLELNNTDLSNLTLLLDLYVSWLDRVHLYEFEGRNLVNVRNVELSLPFSEREIPSPNIMTALRIPAESERTFLVSISGKSSLLVGGFLHSEYKAHEQQFLVHLINGGIIFSITLFSLYNLFIYISMRDSSYLYYVGYSVSMLFLLGTLYGFNYQYFWPEFPRWNAFTFAATTQFTSILVVLFVRNFLNSKQVSRVLDGVLSLFLYGSVILLGLSIPELTRSFAIQWSGPLATLGGPTVFLVGFMAWWQGNSAGRSFTIAWSASLLSITMLGLMVMGFVQFRFWLFYACAFGVVLELALLSLALADKYQQMRQERNEATQQALLAEKELASALRKTAAELEYEVQVRTADLRTAKKAAENLARTDELTGMANRRSYFEQGEIVFNRAREEGVVYGILMLDIDHFKLVNDTYGHASGDVVIIKIAHVIEGLLPDDAVSGRIGGEEFGIILPAYTLDTVADVAEAIRERVEQTTVTLDESNELSITVSLGVSEYNLKDQSLDDTMARADMGLYRAKEEGRNRVSVYLEHLD
jgi:diguanylate cyclase (GGDEF)-like protein